MNVTGGKITLFDQAYYHKSKWITPQMQEFLDLLCEKEGFDKLYDQHGLTFRAQ